MKKITVTTLLISLCALTSCGSGDPKEVTFALEEVGEVSIHTENQIAFWADSDTSNNLLTYANATWKYDNPNPVTLNYSVSTEANEYIITVSEVSNSSGDVYTFSTVEQTYDVYNCKVGTTYSWTVTAVYNKTSFTSDPSYFYVTNDGCRNLYIDGVDNSRDIGGRTTEDGQYIVKQGLIYRTGRYNESDEEEVTLNITEAGIDTMVNQLGIKTDIDLRKNELFESNEIGGLTSSPLGEDINYINLPMNFGGQNIFDQRDDDYNALNKASILEFFEVLADESYYPLAFHCTQGKDRTGALAYALEAMLGMSENDILHDYLFTNFAQLNSSSCKVNDVGSLAKIGGYISQMEGETLKEQAYNYLVEYGVPSGTLDAIRNIMLESI